MNVIRRRGWEIPESRATPEHLFFNRRAFLAAPPRAPLRGPRAEHRAGAAHRPTSPIRPSISIRPSATRNTRSTGRSPTRRSTATTTISTNSIRRKNVAKQAQALKIRPWTIKIDGMVEKPIRGRHRRSGPQDSASRSALYRHRCVEAWSMAVPWSGFPMAKLVEMAKPLSSANYVRMETFLDKSIAPGQKQSLVSVALCRGPHHGGSDQRTHLPRHRRLRQADRQAARRADPPRGAVEVRLQARSSRSCASRSPTSGRTSYWEDLQKSEYGFWANVNPEVPHPRWSQATEEADRHRRAAADAAVQRLRRIRRGPLQGSRRQRAAVGVTARRRVMTKSKISWSKIKAGPFRARLSHVGAGRPTITFQRGTSCRHLGWLIWGDATTQRRQHNAIMRRGVRAYNAKRRMPAMRPWQKRWIA